MRRFELLSFASALVVMTSVSCTEELGVTDAPSSAKEYKEVCVSLDLDLEQEIHGTPLTKAVDDTEDGMSTEIRNLCIMQYDGTDDSSELVGRVHYLTDDAEDDEYKLNFNSIRLADSEGKENTLVILANTFTELPESNVGTLGKMLDLTRRISCQADLFGHTGQGELFPDDTCYYQRLNAIAVSTISGDTHIHATLHRSIARINVKIKNTGKDGLVIKSIQLRNVPERDYYVTDYEDFKPENYPGMRVLDYPVINLECDGSSEISQTFYMTANPSGVIENEMPALKNRLRPTDKAAYLEMYGVYGDDEPIRYQFYLGKNLKDDFNIDVNTSYNYTFAFNGKGDVLNDSRVEDFANVDFDVDANSYMLKQPPVGSTTYSFNVVHRPNIFWDNSDNARYDLGDKELYKNNYIGTGDIWHAKVIWYDFDWPEDRIDEFLVNDHGTGAGDYMGDEQRIKVRIPANFPTGNMLIGIYRENSGESSEQTIIWSWHLWISGYDPDDIDGMEPINGQYVYKVPGGEVHKYKMDNSYPQAYMMDRNLGAWDEIECYQMYYQYGRKDPFLGDRPEEYMGGNNIFRPTYTFTNSTTGHTSAKYNDQTNGLTGKNVPYSVMHPTVGIWSGSGYWTSYDDGFNGQLVNNYYKYYIWNDPELSNPELATLKRDNEETSKSFFDPCPPGWCIPRQDISMTFVQASTLEIWNGEFEFPRYMWMVFPTGDQEINSQKFLFPATWVMDYGRKYRDNPYLSNSTIYLWYSDRTNKQSHTWGTRGNLDAENYAPVRCMKCEN